MVKSLLSELSGQETCKSQRSCWTTLVCLKDPIPQHYEYPLQHSWNVILCLDHFKEINRQKMFSSAFCIRTHQANDAQPICLNSHRKLPAPTPKNCKTNFFFINWIAEVRKKTKVGSVPAHQSFQMVQTPWISIYCGRQKNNYCLFLLFITTPLMSIKIITSYSPATLQVITNFLAVAQSHNEYRITIQTSYWIRKFSWMSSKSFHMQSHQASLKHKFKG